MDNIDEWSLELDLRYNNITSNQAPGLNEYEKSVFLTRAEEAVVVGLYNGSLGRSFEETEELVSYLDPLVSQADCDAASGDVHHIIPGSYVYELPEDLLFRTYEKCSINTGNCGIVDAIVIPVTQDEFWRTNRNPFKGPNSRKVLRLSYADSSMTSTETSVTKYSELVSKYPISSYTVRYLRRPEPIILADLADGLTINGQSNARTCELDRHLHDAILNEAVRMAKAVWESR